MGKCPACKTNKDGNHEKCKDIAKFKCGCGCERKYNLRELETMNRKTNERVKCRRKKLNCDGCNREVNILWLCHNNSHQTKYFGCLKCVKNLENERLLHEIKIKNSEIKLREIKEELRKNREQHRDVIRARQKAALYSRYGHDYELSEESQKIYSQHETLLLMKRTTEILYNQRVAEKKIPYNRAIEIDKVVVMFLWCAKQRGFPREIAFMVIIYYLKSLEFVKISDYYLHKSK